MNRATAIVRRELAAAGKVNKALVAANKWWTSLTPAQQKKYLAEHPNSKMGHQARVALHDEMREHLDKMAKNFQPHPAHANAIFRASRGMQRAAHAETQGGRVYANHAMSALNTLRKGLPAVKAGPEAAEHKGHAKHVTRMVKDYLQGAGTYADYQNIGSHGPAGDTLNDAHTLARLATHLHTGAHPSQVQDEMHNLSDHAYEDMHPKTVKKFFGPDGDRY